MKILTNFKKISCLGIFLVLIVSGCEKFLEEKSDVSLSVPESFEDLRALMNNEDQLNRSFPALIELGSDDYYVKSSVLKARREAERLIYMWVNEVERSDVSSWTRLYNTVLTANVVIEGLKRINDGTLYNRNLLKGEAIFSRSYAFYYLAQLFCLPYNEDEKGDLLGIPLRTSSSFSDKFDRSTLEETYQFIIKDLKEAIIYLPESVQYTSRPSKAAGFTLLARLYLMMGDYNNANENAKLALSYANRLMDYNDLDESMRYPFVVNSEVFYYGVGFNGYLLVNSRAFIPKEVYDLYDMSDLRKSLFFIKNSNGDISFKGNYDGTNSIYFAGFATDELYLMLSECEIRLGNVEKGLELLNHLLELRYKKDSFSPYQNMNYPDALSVVLLERRKELIKRGLRWPDLRRMLNEPGRVPELKRKADNGVDDEIYTIKPEPKNYTYPIPSNVIHLYPYEQNPV